MILKGMIVAVVAGVVFATSVVRAVFERRGHKYLHHVKPDPKAAPIVCSGSHPPVQGQQPLGGAGDSGAATS